MTAKIYKTKYKQVAMQVELCTLYVYKVAPHQEKKTYLCIKKIRIPVKIVSAESVITEPTEILR